MYKDPSSGEGRFLRAPRPDLPGHDKWRRNRKPKDEDRPAPLKRRRGRSQPPNSGHKNAPATGRETQIVGAVRERPGEGLRRKRSALRRETDSSLIPTKAVTQGWRGEGRGTAKTREAITHIPSPARRDLCKTLRFPPLAGEMSEGQRGLTGRQTPTIPVHTGCSKDPRRERARACPGPRSGGEGDRGGQTGGVRQNTTNPNNHNTIMQIITHHAHHGSHPLVLSCCGGETQ